MRRWMGSALAVVAVGVALMAPPAEARTARRGNQLVGGARSFDLRDLAGLGDLLGLGGGGLGSLADLLGLGRDSGALGGILGDILGGLGGSRDQGYGDPYGDDYGYRSSRRRDSGFSIGQIFDRIDLGNNGFVERSEVRQFSRRPAAGSRSPQATFRRLDRNRDGRLSQSEFARLFR